MLRHGERLLSAYWTAKREGLWVLTEADRSLTTLRLPQDPNGRPNLANLADQLHWYVTHGYLPKALAVDQGVDLSFPALTAAERPGGPPRIRRPRGP